MAKIMEILKINYRFVPSETDEAILTAFMREMKYYSKKSLIGKNNTNKSTIG